MAEQKDLAVYDKKFENGLVWGMSMLVKTFGKVKAEEINQSMRKNYEELRQKLPLMKTKMAQHLIMYAVRSLLLYNVIQDKMDQDKAFDLITEHGKALLDVEWLEGFSPLVRYLMRSRFFFPLVTRMTREKMNRSKDPNGWHYEFYRAAEDHLLDFDVTRCGMLKFLTEQGTPELTQVICRLDYHAADSFLPKCAKLIRTQTIAEGADCCDFRYVKKST